MPELPEVETVVRTLRPLVLGRRILNAEFTQPRILRGEPSEMSAFLAGRRITAINRHGKFIAIALDPGFLVVHLGMTGKLLVNAEPTKWTHAVFTLDDGLMHYDDPRQFGRLECSRELPERVSALGPEPLEVSLPDFAEALSARRSPVKAVLLNQAVVRGVGNIYADELLFRAGVNPLTFACAIKRGQVEKIYESMRAVLTEAIESRGSSVSNYVDAEGRKGGFQWLHRVYRRTGEPCLTCGERIHRIVISQRGTHYCPRCQKQ